MTNDEALERAIGDWLLRKENEPALLPGEFARELEPSLRVAFLAEPEALAAEAIGDSQLLRVALRRGNGGVTARELDVAAALLPAVRHKTGIELIAAAQ